MSVGRDGIFLDFLIDIECQSKDEYNFVTSSYTMSLGSRYVVITMKINDVRSI